MTQLPARYDQAGSFLRLKYVLEAREQRRVPPHLPGCYLAEKIRRHRHRGGFSVDADVCIDSKVLAGLEDCCAPVYYIRRDGAVAPATGQSLSDDSAGATTTPFSPIGASRGVGRGSMTR